MGNRPRVALHGHFNEEIIRALLSDPALELILQGLSHPAMRAGRVSFEQGVVRKGLCFPVILAKLDKLGHLGDHLGLPCAWEAAKDRHWYWIQQVRAEGNQGIRVHLELWPLHPMRSGLQLPVFQGRVRCKS